MLEKFVVHSKYCIPETYVVP